MDLSGTSGMGYDSVAPNGAWRRQVNRISTLIAHMINVIKIHRNCRFHRLSNKKGLSVQGK
ncbi:MAG: hypothetical protein HW406_500 [Candidatus Brocadiaceae bacterium]|nr:hypothetical protein [Candidatus Brocadiaceae bacterium]